MALRPRRGSLLTVNCHGGEKSILFETVFFTLPELYAELYVTGTYQGPAADYIYIGGTTISLFLTVIFHIQGGGRGFSSPPTQSCTRRTLRGPLRTTGGCGTPSAHPGVPPLVTPNPCPRPQEPVRLVRQRARRPALADERQPPHHDGGPGFHRDRAAAREPDLLRSPRCARTNICAQYGPAPKPLIACVLSDPVPLPALDRILYHHASGRAALAMSLRSARGIGADTCLIGPDLE